ncbi:hypothetical protein NB231_00010 [Nitrococcus mobilis Nb-231]|uniref:Uncharacterized protein n=1 Tax=Nitrococcus mobilis Nb-231 TaxID=314278 RepID=A4BVV2_9GAMM|nr:hypothetical protein NB231_00010 [Nitrococcus mobilis Nb-231]
MQYHSYGVGKKYNKALLPDKFSAALQICRKARR